MSKADKLTKTMEKLKAEGLPVCFANEITNTLSVVPTGSLSLDYAIGVGGYPSPKIVEIFGPPSCGKSVLTLLAMARVTQQGKLAICYDGENNYDSAELNAWRAGFGVKMENVIHIPAMSAEDVINTMIKLIKEIGPDLGLSVIDSTSSMFTDKFLAKEAGEGYIDERPKYLNKLCGTLVLINKYAPVLAISHIMANIGSLSPKPVSKGGNGIKHFASVRLEVAGKSILDVDSEADGAHYQKMDILVYKNKVSHPGRKARCQFDLRNCTFDKYDELISLAEACNWVTVSGSFYSIPAIQGLKVQGRNKLKALLQERQDITAWLFQNVTGKTVEEYNW